MHALLAVLEVDKGSRVICQAEGCGRHVFKRIHVVLDNGDITVLGQQCYSNIYLDGADSSNSHSQYTGTESRKLSPEEVALLIQNTASLIALFESELAFKIEQERLRNEEIERQRKIEEELRARQRAQQTEGIGTEHVMLRDVTCHYCRQPMKTRAKSVPAVGYKCPQCIEFNRSMPSKLRMGVTAEENARANAIDSKKTKSTESDYRNIRG